MGLRITLATAALLGAATLTMGQDFVPFVIPAVPDGASAIALPAAPIAVDGPRVVVRDGQFYLGRERYKVWGVNLCFGADFPTHVAAEAVAARMAAAGINSVRLHHMDTDRYPHGIWDAANPKKLSPQALDRLDYLIDQFARHGIRVDLNLHVGRAHSKYLGLPKPNTDYDKMVDLFTPELIEAQKTYARALLTRVNAYRKVRYADDPAVAFVEITNEDSLFMWGAEDDLRALPEYYANVLIRCQNAWLKARYGSTDKLRAAWSAGAEPLGQNMLRIERWALIGHEGCKAAFKPRPNDNLGTVEVRIDRADTTEWHIQFLQAGLKMQAGRYYTLTFRVRAVRPRAMEFDVCQSHDPWHNLGLGWHVELTPQWQSIRAGFTASADEDNARVTFNLGGSDAAVDIADISLAPGGQEGLREGETLEAGNVRVFTESPSPARISDRLRFLAETEKAYFDGMYSFIKKDLGCRALVTGTIVMGPLGLWGQSGMDFIDGHAYWQHPQFPAPWDQDNWLVEQKAMVDHPDSSTLPSLAVQRLAGKPYTVSEYNHPAPNDYQAECVPMIASFAAAQDWDGVWLFAYSHRTDDWATGQFKSFFDIDANPAKWGFIPSGAIIFRQGAIGPLRDSTVVPLSDGKDVVGDLATLQAKSGASFLTPVKQAVGQDAEGLFWFHRRLAVSLSGKPAQTTAVVGKGCQLAWLVIAPGRGRLVTMEQRAIVLVGYPGVIPFNEGPSQLTKPPFVAMTIVSMDGRPLDQSRKVLLTACGRCENTGMEFSEDRRTVGLHWGHAPVRIEPIEGPFYFFPGKWRCQALSPEGKPVAEVPVESADCMPFHQLSAKYATMWYLLTRQE